MKATIRNDAPTIKVRNVDLPIVRVGYSGLLSQTQSFAGAGYLIGMLALTYSGAQKIPATFKSEDIPVVGIRTTD